MNPQCSAWNCNKSRNTSYKLIHGPRRPSRRLQRRYSMYQFVITFSWNGVRKELRDIPSCFTWCSYFSTHPGDVRPTRIDNSIYKGTKKLCKFGDRPCKIMKSVSLHPRLLKRHGLSYLIARLSSSPSLGSRFRHHSRFLTLGAVWWDLG